jgi:hypothetical protein
MNNLRNKLIVPAVIGILVVIGGAMNSRQAGAQGPSDGIAVRITSPLPVPTSDADNPARHPFQIRLCRAISSNILCTSDGAGSDIVPNSFTVPNAHLVVEYVSGNCSVLGGGQISLNLKTVAGGVVGLHSFNPVQQLPIFPGVSVSYVVTQPTRIYADAGTEVSLNIGLFGASGPSGCNLELSGYTVTP